MRVATIPCVGKTFSLKSDGLIEERQKWQKGYPQKKLTDKNPTALRKQGASLKKRL
jgi:hypothetical protein